MNDLTYDTRVKQQEILIAQLEKDKRALLNYVARAKEWFDHFGADAPIVFGGEAEMSEEARALLIQNGVMK